MLKQIHSAYAGRYTAEWYVLTDWIAWWEKGIGLGRIKGRFDPLLSKGIRFVTHFVPSRALYNVGSGEAHRTRLTLLDPQAATCSLSSVFGPQRKKAFEERVQGVTLDEDGELEGKRGEKNKNKIAWERKFCKQLISFEIIDKEFSRSSWEIFELCIFSER